MNRACVLELIKANVGMKINLDTLNTALNQSQDSSHLIFYLLWTLTTL